MNSHMLKKPCPRCGGQMEERKFPGGVGPGSASTNLSGPYLYCAQCGYAEPKAEVQLE